DRHQQRALSGFGPQAAAADANQPAGIMTAPRNTDGLMSLIARERGCPNETPSPHGRAELPLVRASHFDAGLTSSQTRVSTLNLLVSQKTLNGRTCAWNTWAFTAGSALTIDSASSDEVASKTISATLSQ